MNGHTKISNDFKISRSDDHNDMLTLLSEGEEVFRIEGLKKKSKIIFSIAPERIGMCIQYCKGLTDKQLAEGRKPPKRSIDQT